MLPKFNYISLIMVYCDHMLWAQTNIYIEKYNSWYYVPIIINYHMF